MEVTPMVITKPVLSFPCPTMASHSPITKSHPPSLSHQKPPLKHHRNLPHKESPSLSVSKRTLNLSFIATTTTLCFGVLPNIDKSMAQEEKQLEMELERYTDSNEGFTLFRPSSWIKIEKAGATVLFEQANAGSNNLGVVVSPVRLTSLGQFGSPEFVIDKLIQAEKRKESTNDAEVIKFEERSGRDGLQVYEFEYKLDSTRGGMKRIFSAAFVTSKKLYLLNIAHSDKPESPLDDHTRILLEQVLHSFDATS